MKKRKMGQEIKSNSIIILSQNFDNGDGHDYNDEKDELGNILDSLGNKKSNENNFTSTVISFLLYSLQDQVWVNVDFLKGHFVEIIAHLL